MTTMAVAVVMNLALCIFLRSSMHSSQFLPTCIYFDRRTADASWLFRPDKRETAIGVGADSPEGNRDWQTGQSLL